MNWWSWFTLRIWILMIVFCACNAVRSGSNAAMNCSDATSCTTVHLEAPELTRMIRQRCSSFSFLLSSSSSRRITFTHVTKSGGSSVTEFFSARAKDRTHMIPTHEHFIMSSNAEPNSTFVVLLRDPVVKAISFYSYVNTRRSLTPYLWQDMLWSSAASWDPEKWTSDPVVLKLLSIDPAGLFLRNESHPKRSHAVSMADYQRIKTAPEPKLKTFIPGTLPEFLSYTSALPEAFQCRQHLEVAFILLKHYEVVGTLEHIADFYRVLSVRAGLPMDGNFQPPHENKTAFKLKPAVKEAMRRNLEGPLFCATVLWKIAGLISAADLQCHASPQAA